MMKEYQTHRQRSCQDGKGNLLYPYEWICTECGNNYTSESIAKYCCWEKKEIKKKMNEITKKLKAGFGSALGHLRNTIKKHHKNMSKTHCETLDK